MEQGLTRNGLRVVDVGYKNYPKGCDRPIKGFVTYPKGTKPAHSLIEWKENGKFRYDGTNHELDLVKSIGSVTMTTQQSAVYEFLLEKAYNAVKKAVETPEEEAKVVEACGLLMHFTDLVKLTKVSTESTIDDDAINLTKIFLYLINTSQIEIFGEDGKMISMKDIPAGKLVSFVPKLYIL